MSGTVNHDVRKYLYKFVPEVLNKNTTCSDKYNRRGLLVFLIKCRMKVRLHVSERLIQILFRIPTNS